MIGNKLIISLYIFISALEPVLCAGLARVFQFTIWNLRLVKDLSRKNHMAASPVRGDIFVESHPKTFSSSVRSGIFRFVGVHASACPPHAQAKAWTPTDDAAPTAL
jgi:hypothetical protein